MIYLYLLFSASQASTSVMYIHRPDSPVSLSIEYTKRDDDGVLVEANQLIIVSLDTGIVGKVTVNYGEPVPEGYTMFYDRDVDPAVHFLELLGPGFESVRVPKRRRTGKCDVDGVGFHIFPTEPGTDTPMGSDITMTEWVSPQSGRCRIRLPGGDVIETHFVIIPAQP